LQAEQAVVYRFGEGFCAVEKMMQRAFVFDEPETETVLFRDADSRITDREVAAVREWLTSGYGTHVMRDFPYQFAPLGGGLWGTRKGSGRHLEMRRLWEEYKRVTPEWPQLDDQVFLHRVIWPIVRGDTLLHDGIGNMAAVRPFPIPFNPEQGFVGEIFLVREGKDFCIPEHRKVREDFQRLYYE
jgi:hypothetical protein